MRGQSEPMMVYVIVILALLVLILAVKTIDTFLMGGSMKDGCKMLMKQVWDATAPFSGGGFVPFTVICDIVM